MNNSSVFSLTRLCYAFTFIMVLNVILFGQSNFYDCKVTASDFNTDRSSSFGNFSVDISQSESYWIKSLPFVEKGLFVSTSFFFKEGDRNDAANLESEIILRMVISKTKYKSIETEMKNSDVLNNASNAVPLEYSKKIQLETFYLAKKQPIIVGFSCIQRETPKKSD
jgi:hypothetical protein